MAKKQPVNSQTLNYALVVSVLLLIVLVVYANRFRNRLETITSPDSASALAQTQPNASDNRAGTARENAIPPPRDRQQNLMADLPLQKPAEVTGSLEDPREVKRVIANQSRQLRAEAAAQGFRPENKRALALSEEDIRQLEMDGNIIY